MIASSVAVVLSKIQEPTPPNDHVRDMSSLCQVANIRHCYIDVRFPASHLLLITDLKLTYKLPP